MLAPAFVLGYHGCDRAVGERILQNKIHVTTSRKKYDWLGNGAYFWENSPERALQWAGFVRNNPQHFNHKILHPFVAGAIIDLGNCLDLTDAESLKIVKDAYSVLSRSYRLLDIPMPVNEAGYKGDEDLVKRSLDCAVINTVHELRHDGLQPFDSARGIFTEGRELYRGAKIQDKTHIQICVRDPKKSVRGYFLPVNGR